MHTPQHVITGAGALAACFGDALRGLRFLAVFVAVCGLTARPYCSAYWLRPP